MAPVPSETNRRPARPSFDNGIQGISVPSKSQPVFQDRSPPALPAQSTLPFENLPPTNVIAPETATESCMTQNSPTQASLGPASMNRLFDDIFTNVNFESEISKWITQPEPLCLQMFLTRFNPILPVIHLPTFRLSSNQPLLLMAMCTLGTLFLGSPLAKSMGKKMLDQLHKASLASVRIYIQ